jgi:hypothetical protein
MSTDTSKELAMPNHPLPSKVAFLETGVTHRDIWNLQQLATAAHRKFPHYGENDERYTFILKACGSVKIQALLDVMHSNASEFAELKRRYESMKAVVIQTTVDHDGCFEGKKSFLEECGLEGDPAVPTQKVVVTRTVTFEIPDLGNDSGAKEYAEEIADDYFDGDESTTIEIGGY